MAVDDIRVKLTFKSSRKRFRLRKLAGDGAVVALIDLWIETASQFPLGTLYDCTPDDIEHMAGWTGSPGLFVSAAVDAGFLIQKTETEWELHDWKDHQRWVVHAPARVEAGRIAAHKRWESAHGADVMRTACGAHSNGNADGNAPIPSPSPFPLNPISSPQEKPRRFAPPTAPEVAEYMDGRGEHIDAGRFVDFYASKGWKVGKNPMKDWQAAARGWYRRDKDGGSHAPQTGRNAAGRRVLNCEDPNVQWPQGVECEN